MSPSGVPSLQKLLHTLLKLSKQDMARRLEKANVSVSPLQYWVLFMIKDAPRTLNEIAREFDIKPPSLVPYVDTLEYEGYLKRVDDTEDRRKTQLVITEKGRELTSRIQIEDKHAGLNTAFESLGSQKQQQLIELLNDLLTHFPQ